MSDEPTNGRVTNQHLQSELNLVRQEQRTEHTKTRALVIILSVPNIVKAVPFILGYFGWHVW